MDNLWNEANRNDTQVKSVKYSPLRFSGADSAFACPGQNAKMNVRVTMQAKENAPMQPYSASIVQKIQQ